MSLFLIDGEDAQFSHPNLENQVGATGISNMRSSIINGVISQKNNQSQVVDMNDDSALKAIKNKVSSIEENQTKENFKFNIRKK